MSCYSFLCVIMEIVFTSCDAILTVDILLIPEKQLMHLASWFTDVDISPLTYICNIYISISLFPFCPHTHCSHVAILVWDFCPLQPSIIIVVMCGSNWISLSFPCLSALFVQFHFSHLGACTA